MPRFCFVAALLTACAPATHTVAARVADTALDPVSEERVGAQPKAPHARRVARLAPPFASSPSTRRVDESREAPELELAAAP